MSERNVEIVVGQFDGVNKREFGRVMDAYADDVILVPHGDLGWLLSARLGGGATVSTPCATRR